MARTSSSQAAEHLSPAARIAVVAALASAVACGCALLALQTFGGPPSAALPAVLAACCGMAAAIGGVVLVAARQAIAKDARRITRALDHLASPTPLPETALPAGPEWAHLTAAIERRRAAEADRQSADERARQDAQREADERAATENARQAAVRMHSAVAGLMGAAIVRLADGDLDTRITVDLPPDYRPFREAFNLIAETLAGTRDEIGSAGARLGESGRAVTAASAHLARRAEKLAARLEHELSAFDRRRHGDAAASSDGLSGRLREARSDAAQGLAVSTEAIRAMTGIEASSSEIGKITGMIEEIAFQTNLLALNAGVEAARAGDAGRGFAVVASEVRALSQRSAEAASSIKSLIAASGQEVRRGVRLASETGETMGRLDAELAQLSALAATLAETPGGDAELRALLHTMGGVRIACRRNIEAAEALADIGLRIAEDADAAGSAASRLGRSRRISAEAERRSGLPPADPLVRAG